MLKYLGSILHKVLLCYVAARRQTRWPCKLAQIGLVIQDLYCLRVPQCAGKRGKALKQNFWLMLMGRTGNGVTSYLENTSAQTGQKLMIPSGWRAVPCQVSYSKYFCIDEIVGKMKS